MASFTQEEEAKWNRSSELVDVVHINLVAPVIDMKSE